MGTILSIVLGIIAFLAIAWILIEILKWIFGIFVFFLAVITSIALCVIVIGGAFLILRQILKG